MATLFVLRGEKLPRWMRRVAYLLMDGKCVATCAYCELSGAPVAGERVKLSRVTWYKVDLREIVSALSEFERVCIQTVIGPNMGRKLVQLVRIIARVNPRISVSIAVAGKPLLEELRDEGVETLGIGLDAATPRLAMKLGKPYPYSLYMRTLRDAVEVFGDRRVYVHLIVGVGEKASELAATMRHVKRLGGRIALFAYTPSAKLGGKPPSLCYYRGAQLYRQLLDEGVNPDSYITPSPFNPQGWVLKRTPPLEIVERAIVTSGCPACNRPYYNERPRGTLYNIPWEPDKREVYEALEALRACGESNYSNLVTSI